jgi:hypothetical protein
MIAVCVFGAAASTGSADNKHGVGDPYRAAISRARSPLTLKARAVRMAAGHLVRLHARRPFRRFSAAHVAFRRGDPFVATASHGKLHIRVRRGTAPGKYRRLVVGTGCTAAGCGRRFRMRLRLTVIPTTTHGITPVPGIPAGETESQQPVVSTSPDGSTFLIWSIHEIRETSATGTVWIATKAPGADEWTIKRISRPGTGNPNDTRVVAGSDGTTAVAWVNRKSVSPRESRGILWVRVREAGSGQWGPATVLSKADEDVQAAELSVANDGDVTAFWYRVDNDAIYARTTERPGREWQAPVRLSGIEAIGLATTPSGEAVVAGQSAGDYVADSRDTSSGQWRMSTPIWSLNTPEAGTTNFSPANPAAYAAPDGTVVAAWSIWTQGPSTPSRNELMLSVRPPGGQWSPPTVLDSTPDPNFDYQFQIAGDYTGRVTVLAGHELGSNTQSVVAYTSDPGAHTWAVATLRSPISFDDGFRISSGTGDGVAASYELRNRGRATRRLYLMRRRNGSVQWGRSLRVAPEVIPTQVNFGFRSSGSVRLPLGPEMIVRDGQVLIVWQAADGLRSATANAAAP